MPVRIGITSSIERGEDPYAKRTRGNYGRAVLRAGAEPVYVLNELGRIDDYLDAFDGWVFSGGSDIDPAVYGGNRAAPGLDEVDAARDAFEMVLIPRLIAARVPVLFVCRGLQSLNVALGGTLIEDLPSEMPVVEHAQHLAEPPLARELTLDDHVVEVAPDSRLAAALGCTRLKTNSLHHQGLRAVAPHLRIVATTRDGVIEGIDGPADHPFCIGVQWHPESLDDEPSRRLFAALVAAARDCAAFERTERAVSADR